MSEPEPKRTAFETWGFTLPIPYYIGDRRIETFELGPVKGKLRKELANLVGKPEPYETLAVLKHVISDLGGLGPAGDMHLRKMPMPSVEYVLFVLELERLPKVPVEAQCENPACRAALHVEVPLQEIGCVIDPMEVVHDRGVACLDKHINDPHTGEAMRVRYRIPTLDDNIKFIEKMVKRGAEKMGDTSFEELASTMVDYNGRGSGLSVQELEDLDYDLVAALTEGSDKEYPPAVDTDLDLECDACDHITEVPLPLKRWLVPLDRRDRKETPEG